MALEGLLGQEGLKLIEFPKDGLRGVLKDYLPIEFRPWELLVANIAEFAISVHAKPGVQGPYPVDPSMATYVVHKSNSCTLFYTCAFHVPQRQELVKSEYIFLFTSDCWKLREILGQEPPTLLVERPDQVWQKIMGSGWRFLPQVSSSHAIAQETVLLWSAKAIILTDPTLDESSLREKVRTAARKLGVAEKAPPAVAVVSG